MALLFADGFNHYAAAQILDWWTSGTAGITAVGRNSNNGLHIPGLLYKYLPNASGSTCIFGAALFFTTIGGGPGSQHFCDIDDGSTSQVAVALFTDGTFRVIVPAGTFFSTFALSVNTWYYVHVKAIISNTVGSVQILVNGTPVLTLVGIDTQATANASWNGFTTTGGGMNMNDLYLCDGTGSDNNDVIAPDVLVETLRPTTDAVAAGFNHGLTPSTGTDHGALVDEAAPNDDTDYNSSASAGVKDTYRLASMVSTGAVAAVLAVARTRKLDNVTKTACAVIRHAGTDYDGATFGVATVYDYTADIYERNPVAAAPWTPTAVNALELGLKTVV